MLARSVLILYKEDSVTIWRCKLTNGIIRHFDLDKSSLPVLSFIIQVTTMPLLLHNLLWLFRHAFFGNNRMVLVRILVLFMPLWFSTILRCCLSNHHVFPGSICITSFQWCMEWDKFKSRINSEENLSPGESKSIKYQPRTLWNSYSRKL